MILVVNPIEKSADDKTLDMFLKDDPRIWLGLIKLDTNELVEVVNSGDSRDFSGKFTYRKDNVISIAITKKVADVFKKAKKDGKKVKIFDNKGGRIIRVD